MVKEYFESLSSRYKEVHDAGGVDMQLQELDGEDEEQTESRTNCQTVHSSINNTLSVTQNGGSGNNQVRSPSTNPSSFRNVSFRV